MTPGIKPLLAGNWKMNGLAADLNEVKSMISSYSPALHSVVDLLICIPATLIVPACIIATDSGVHIGGQDCHAKASGAHTGDVSAEMITDAGAGSVIVGHSERRTDHFETSETVRGKATAALAQGMQTIICIGETEAERKSGVTLNVLKKQMDGSIPDNWPEKDELGEVVIAYEPVWAIGTGLTPTIADIAEAHDFMRKELIKRFGERGAKTRLLYGGSVKPGNAVELMAIVNVDGALVGGASLKADDFMAIANTYSRIN